MSVYNMCVWKNFQGVFKILLADSETFDSTTNTITTLVVHSIVKDLTLDLDVRRIKPARPAPTSRRRLCVLMTGRGYPKPGFRVLEVPLRDGFKRQVEHGFSSFFAQVFTIFDDFSKFLLSTFGKHSTL